MLNSKLSAMFLNGTRDGVNERRLTIGNLQVNHAHDKPQCLISCIYLLFRDRQHSGAACMFIMHRAFILRSQAGYNNYQRNNSAFIYTIMYK